MRSRRRIQKDEKCRLCSKDTRFLAEFNDSLLCPKCFDEEITNFAEGRKFKMRVALA